MGATRRITLSVAAVALLLAWGPAAGAADQPTGLPSDRGPAPVIGTDQPDAIPGRYLVVFEKGASARARAAAIAAARRDGAQVHFTYSSAIQGFAATLPEAALRGVTRNPNVAYVEADMRVQLEGSQSPATWGIDRIDQRDLPLNNTYNWNTSGSGVNAYIIDTGIRRTHNEFGGRALHGYTAINDGRGSTDCNGHGTHVAGTVGGSTYGVAKDVTLYAVRVLNCNGSGTISGVVAGVDWVTNNHQSPAVANMSLGGSANSTLDNAVDNSISAGVTYSIASGNSNANACNFSPARVAAALTVNASTDSDSRASFSNYGSCTDIFAPGQNITAAWYTSDTATNTISGTSMAAPHVAGVAALYLESNPTASPSTVNSAVINNASTNRISNPGSGSPNRLVYSLFDGEPDPDPDPDPEPDPEPCQYSESFSGFLSGSGDYDYHPNGTYYYSPISGAHRGCLIGADGTDFDLYLYKWTSWGWWPVAWGTSPDSVEDVTYNGTAGYYVWEIYSYSGSGSYTFTMDRP